MTSDWAGAFIVRDWLQGKITEAEKDRKLKELRKLKLPRDTYRGSLHGDGLFLSPGHFQSWSNR